MQIILLERIEKLGQMGDLVNVKTGYARNFLIPQGKALRATKANTERFEAERAQREANNLELRKDAETEAGKMRASLLTWCALLRKWASYLVQLHHAIFLMQLPKLVSPSTAIR